MPAYLTEQKEAFAGEAVARTEDENSG
jgi:hypothetical protein